MSEAARPRLCNRAALRAAGLSWSPRVGDLTSADRSVVLSNKPRKAFEALLRAGGGPLPAATLKQSCGARDFYRVVETCNHEIVGFGLAIVGRGTTSNREYALQFIRDVVFPASGEAGHG